MSLTTNLQADFLLRKGQSFAEKGNFIEALATFNKALEMKPNYDFVHLHKGLALSRFNKYKEAVASVELAINSKPSSEVFWFYLGKIHFDHKNYVEAIKALEEARKLDPSYKAPLPFIALCKMSIDGLFEDGYSLIKNEQDLRYRSCESRLLLFCNTYLFNKGDKELLLQECYNLNSEGKISLFDERSLDISFLVKIFWPTASKYYLQGVEKTQNGDQDAGLVSFATAARHKKKMLQTYKQQIQIYFDKGKYEEALKVSRDIPKNLQDLEILCSRGEILSKLKLNEEAANIFKKICIEFKRFCSDWSSGFPTCHSLGLCLINLQDHGSALICFDKAVEFLHEDVAKKKLQEVYALHKKADKN